MIVRTLEGMAGTDREVHAPTFVSRRMLLNKDGMGFSFHDTILYAGTQTRIWYKNHLEAVYNVGPHTISFPRLQKASNVKYEEKWLVSDEDFTRAQCTLSTGMTVISCVPGRIYE